MTFAKEQMTAAANSAAAEIAQKLGLHVHDDIDTLKPEQFIMIASSEGVQMGVLKTRDMVNMRYIAYKLNGHKIFEKRYLYDTKGVYHDKPTTILFFDKEATIYVGE